MQTPKEYRCFTLLIITVLTVPVIYQESSSQTYSSCLLGTWEQYGQGPRRIDPGRSGDVPPSPRRRGDFEASWYIPASFEIACECRDFRSYSTCDRTGIVVHVAASGGNYGGVEADRFAGEQGCPVRAWFGKTNFNYPRAGTGSWTFKYDAEEDGMIVEFEFASTHATLFAAFQRVKEGMPCPETGGYVTTAPPKRAQDSPSRGQPRQSGNRHEEQADCMPQIRRAFLGRLVSPYGTKVFEFTIEASCIPMRFELWIDGERHDDRVERISGSLLQTTVRQYDRQTRHRIQLGDLDTGRKSNIVEVEF